EDADRLAGRNAAHCAGLERLLVLDSGCVESQRLGAGGLPVEELLAFVARDPRLDAVLGHGQRRAGAIGRVALHLPCTQRNVTCGAQATRAVLTRLGLEPVVVGERGCCGAAGSHMLFEPERADALRAPLVAAITAVGAATLATGNVGCRLHLAEALPDLHVLHPIELLDQCLP